jgi:hypothetical protein
VELNTSGNSRLPLMSAGKANRGLDSGLDLSALLTACLDALDGGRWHKCKKCIWIWRQNQTKRYLAGLKATTRGKWLARVKPKRCPNCLQTNWERGYSIRGYGKKRIANPKRRHSRELLVKRMRMALLEHSVRMKEAQEVEIWERTKELMKRLG